MFSTVPPDIPQDATLKECEKCHESIWVFRDGGIEYIIENASSDKHECWEALPVDANLLVIDE